MGQCLNSAPPVWLRYFNYIFFFKKKGYSTTNRVMKLQEKDYILYKT